MSVTNERVDLNDAQKAQIAAIEFTIGNDIIIILGTAFLTFFLIRILNNILKNLKIKNNIVINLLLFMFAIIVLIYILNRFKQKSIENVIYGN